MKLNNTCLLIIFSTSIACFSSKASDTDTENVLTLEAKKCSAEHQTILNFTKLAPIAFKIASEHSSYAEQIRQFVAIISFGKNLNQSTDSAFIHEETGCRLSFLFPYSRHSQCGTEEKTLKAVFDDFSRCLDRKAEEQIKKGRIIQNTLKAHRELNKQ